MARLRHAQRLAGETMREIGILTLVFAPLESVFNDRAVDAWLLVSVIVVSVTVIVCGILVEVRD